MSDDNLTTPKWAEWRNRTYVQLWQAVALTFGVEPSGVREKGTNGKPAYSDIDGLDQRLDVAVAELGRLEWERPNALPRIIANHWNRSVTLTSFADLADQMGWPLDACVPRNINNTPPALKKVNNVAPEMGNHAPQKADLELKRKALVAKYLPTWPDIESDLNHASENGLSDAAKGTKRGDWFESAALAWADQRGKRVAKQTIPASNLMCNLPGIKHTSD